jgi:osmotically-inducible protein OsmY
MQPEKSDEQLQSDVQNELRREPALDAAEIGVMAEGGVVTLGGHVPDLAQQQVVEEIAAHVPGVRAVVDELVVGPHVDDDVGLAREALDALRRTSGIPEDRVRVIVHDGRVRLEGIVDTPAERDAAEASVGDVVLGRGSLENAIDVRPTPA